MKSKIIKTTISVIKTIVSIVIIYFLADVLIKNWSQINFNELTINWTYLILAMIPFIMHIFLYAATWHKLLILTGEKISFIGANNIYANSQFWRYIPGRVMLFVRRIMLCTKNGISTWNASISIILELIFLVISAVTLSIVTLIFWPNMPNSIKLLSLGASIVLIIAIICMPKFSESITRLIQRLMKLKDQGTKVHSKNMPWITLAYISTWTLQGQGFT